MAAPLDVVTVGDVMVDVTVAAPALARGGDVHGRVRIRPGGSAANAAVWAAAHGARACVIGRVGADLPGRLLARELERRHVEPMLAVDPDAETGTMLVVTEAGERSMVSDRGTNGRLTPDDLPEEIEAPAVLVSGYLLLFEPTTATAVAALERARGPHVSVDAASWPLLEPFGTERFFEATARASVLFANEREAGALTGVSGGEAAAAVLASSYPTVCVKLGARGAVAVRDGRTVVRPAVEVAEVDPTGAGDAFDGAFLAALVGGASLEETLTVACRAGARAAASPEPWPPADLAEAGDLGARPPARAAAPEPEVSA